MSNINWLQAFSQCRCSDDFANSFTNLLSETIVSCTRYIPSHRRQRLPRHLVLLLRTKKKAWTRAKRTGNISPFKIASRVARAALRQYRRNGEERLIYSNNRNLLFSHMNNAVTNNKCNTIRLCTNGTALTDIESCNAFLEVFSANFCSSSNINLPTRQANDAAQATLASFNCTPTDVAAALQSCPNSSSSPDNISFKLLKVIAKYIVYPLNIIYQHSLFEGSFPRIWKHAAIIPLFKGKGSRSSPANYRPISLCHCLGKLLERIVYPQLTNFLKDNNLISDKQHGFTTGKSTLTNLLSCESTISEIEAAGHAYDILTFDFTKAFDRVQHSHVISSAADLGIEGTALKWISSFLSGRTFQVRIGNALSGPAIVQSGVIQGSSLGPVLYNISINPLLRKLTLPSQGFADDLKFVADVVTHSRSRIQQEVDTISLWADEHCTPLSLEKCTVLHCGHHQPNNDYTIHNAVMKRVDVQSDLGIIRSCDGTFTEHCRNAVAKASKISGLIRHVFRSGHRKLLWPAFTQYVLPILSYCSPVWNPRLKRDITAIESVQRKFSKKILGLSNLSYNERLHQLHALSLTNRRTLTDLVTTYKYLHGLLDSSPSDVGLTLASASTRGQSTRLFRRRPINCITANRLSYRAAFNTKKKLFSIRT